VWDMIPNTCYDNLLRCFLCLAPLQGGLFARSGTGGIARDSRPSLNPWLLSGKPSDCDGLPTEM
jgi:hypothetical protein